MVKKILILIFLVIFALQVFSSVVCSEDVDCGQPEFIGSDYNDGVRKVNFRIHQCNNPATDESYCSYKTLESEIYSYESEVIACHSDVDCNDSDSSTTDICVNPGTPESFCRNDPILVESWFAIEPIQCGGNPWEQLREKRLFRDERERVEFWFLYYQNIEILDYREEQVYGAVCRACSCPRGDKIYVLVEGHHYNDLINLGWEPATDVPEEPGCSIIKGEDTCPIGFSCNESTHTCETTKRQEQSCEEKYGCLVDRQYLDLLHRNSELQGHEYYVGALCSDEMTYSGLVNNFITSKEFSLINNYDFILRSYFGIYNNQYKLRYDNSLYKLPDYETINYWNNKMEKFSSEKESKLSVINSFSADALWDKKTPEISNSDFVDLLYKHILGRAPEKAGYDYHLSNLENNKITREEMLLVFIDSAEAKGKYANQVLTEISYFGLLGRAAKETGLFITPLD